MPPRIPASLQAPPRVPTVGEIREAAKPVVQRQVTSTTTKKPVSAYDKAYDRAVENIRRRIQGKRITFYVSGEYSDLAQKIYTDILKENPNLQSAVQQATELKLEAQRLGFGDTSLSEFATVQKRGLKEFEKDRGVFVTPTPTEVETLQSLPADIRTQTPTEIRLGVSLPADIRTSKPTEVILRRSLPQELRDLPPREVERIISRQPEAVIQEREQAFSLFGSAASGLGRVSERLEPPFKKGLELVGVPKQIISSLEEKQVSQRPLREFITFSFFTPAISTAVAAESAYTETVTASGQRIFIKKTDLAKYLNAPVRRGKIIDYKLSSSTKTNRALKLLENAQTPSARKLALDTIKEEYGSAFTKELLAQEFGVISKVATKQPPSSTLEFFGGTSGAKLEALPVVKSGVRESVYAGTGLYERTDSSPVFNVRTRSTQDLGVGTLPLLDSKQDTRQETIIRQEPKLSNLLIPRLDQDTVTTPTTVTIPRLTTTPTTTTPQIPRNPIFTTPRPPRTQPPRTPRQPEPSTPIIPFFFPGESPKGRKEEGFGYHAFALENSKYRKLTRRPHTREGALDVAARVVDNTTSAQGEIRPVRITKKGKVKGKKSTTKNKLFKKDDLKKGDGYYLLNTNKFRDYKIVKGRRKQLKNKLIEKKNRRIDTRGEARGLTVAQALSRRRRQAFGITSKKGGRFRL